MARHAASSGENTEAPRRTPARDRRAEARARAREARRLAEREQISGEIQTPADITAVRARRADRPNRPVAQPSKRTPVSAAALVPERTFSARIIVLTIVALVVISFLVPTVRTYFQQRGEMNELAAQIAEEEQRQAELYSEIARWEDPEFIRRQARERINLVMPGDKRYHVIGDPSEGIVAEDETLEDEEPEDWSEELWESVVDSAEAAPEPDAEPEASGDQPQQSR
ncbi:FtsB family cell division protein [Nesterenkonia flava]|uniref:Septum formation initiator family protein n=1 Tax=Nesterenkonia flava TaxID=469799 RepID=A0ABU1FQB6_9MICC|nr:septum formation initiator family protein [Nesterenkonia flava]MDR5710828.1 septum formation initiator family protein [Nesterenkonia flava]